MQTYKLGEGEVLLQLTEQEVCLVGAVLGLTHTATKTNERFIVYSIYDALSEAGYTNQHPLYQEFICKITRPPSFLEEHR